jgi:hypothetical protein
METKVCKRFETCSCPLCPMDEGSLTGGIWYPDEQYCTAYAFSSLLWIRNQRKIAKRTHNVDYYFNIQMLSQNCIISKGIAGLDPDRIDINEELQLKSWLKKHPEKRKISETELEKLKNRMKDVRRKLNTL